MTTLAKRLEQLRTKKNISRVDLSAALGLPRMTVEKIEAGKLTPTTEQAEKLAAYFGVTVPYLRGETDELVSMAGWLEGNVPDEEPVLPSKPAPKPKINAQEKEDSAVFNLLLKSDAFKAAVLSVLRTPEGQKLIAEAIKKSGR